MDYVKLGTAGMKVSRICLGMMSYGSQAERTWHLDEAAAEPIVKAAVDGGITFFDTADADFDVADRLTQVAAERGAPPAQVALAWLLSRPGVTAPIVGATRLGHITDALAASQLTLTEEEGRRLEQPYVPHPVLGHS